MFGLLHRNFLFKIGILRLTLLTTAILATVSRMLNQIPISCALSAIGRRTSQMKLSESMRISKMLLARAKNGARGNAATKMVMKPNCITGDQKEHTDRQAE